MFGEVPEITQFFHILDSGAFGEALPGIVEEYGGYRKMDIFVSPSYKMFKDAIPDVKPTGVTVDNKGNFKAIGNLIFELMIEKNETNA
jgi:hypothetical protein